jgi:hypothetical protein
MTGRRLLISLYPRGWRQRYGAEFDALLDDLGTEAHGTRIDLIRGAIDAQLHRRRYPMIATGIPPRWPAWLLLTGLGAVGGLFAFSLMRYPGTLHEPGAPVYLVAVCLIFAVYLGLAGRAVRRPGTGRALGAFIGLAAAASWSAEIWAGGPANLDRSAESAVGGAFALLAVATTVSAGIVAGARYRSPGAALRGGLIAGLISGVAVFCFAVVMTLTNLGVLGTRDDYRRQFATSHAPDMATFLVGDILAAVIAHLMINMILGLIGGGLGALVATSVRRQTGVATAID